MSDRRSIRRACAAVGACFVAALGTACGAARVETPAARPTVTGGNIVATVAADGSAPATPASESSPVPIQAQPAAETGTAKLDSTGTRTEAPGVANPANGSLAASVDPSCVEIGDTVTVTVSGAPRASLALAVAFADDQAHGLMAFADADDTGSYAWKIVIPVDAPAGDASVLVGARDPADGRDVGTTSAFLVSEGDCR